MGPGWGRSQPLIGWASAPPLTYTPALRLDSSVAKCEAKVSEEGGRQLI